MKKLHMLFVVGFISFFSYSQEVNYCGWDYTVTANNAVIAIQQDNLENINISGSDMTSSISFIQCPMWIGVFYQSFEGGPLECAGYTEFNATQSMAIAAWGDDSTTSEQDGFNDGDSYLFGLCVDGVGDFYGSPEMSIESPFTDTYFTNGFASLNAINFGPANCVSCIIEGCWPVNVAENKKDKKIIKRFDVFGRDVQENYLQGVYFEIFNDNSTVKKYIY